MSSSSGTEKICTVCGEDCSNKPRTKDARGNYYCKECYEQASAQRKSKAASPPASATDRRLVDPAPLSADMMDQLIAAAPVVAVTAHCSQCGFALPPGGIICANCGFNEQTKSAVSKTKIKKAPRGPTGGIIWPPLVGIVSMVIGACGVLLYGGMLVLGFIGSSNDTFSSRLTPLGTISMLTWLAAWVLRDGWRIVKRDSAGVTWIRYWAMAKLLIYGSCLGLFMSIPIRPLQEALNKMGHGQSQMSASDFKATFLLVMLWFLLWPIFVMIFFFTPRIQADVEQWD